LGLALGAKIDSHCQFARKHYFYPDLPKGYQITQYERPLCRGGTMEFEVDGGVRTIGLRQVHLEEDAGRSVHAEAYVGEEETLVDLNRCGVPLVEIVTEPELLSPREAVCFVSELRRLVRALGISEAQMERGELRCDANVSIRGAQESAAGVSTEIKNLNSLHALEWALTAEITRQMELRRQGKEVAHQTLLWQAAQQRVVATREKEYAHDYRYCPEPDLPPVRIPSRWLANLRRNLPELPLVRKRRLVELYLIPRDRARMHTEQPGLADYFEEVAQASGSARLACNWVTGEVVRWAKKLRVPMAQFPISASVLAQLLLRVRDGALSDHAARHVLEVMIATGKPMEEVLAVQGASPPAQEVAEIIAEVLGAHADLVAQFHEGKTELLDFFMGETMARLRGRADARQVIAQLKEKLGEQDA